MQFPVGSEHIYICAPTKRTPDLIGLHFTCGENLIDRRYLYHFSFFSRKQVIFANFRAEGRYRSRPDQVCILKYSEEN